MDVCTSSAVCAACNQAVLSCDALDHAEVCLAAIGESQRSRQWVDVVGVSAAITVKRLGIGEVWHSVLDFLCPPSWWEEFEITCPHTSESNPCVWRGWRTDLYDHMRLCHDEVTCEHCRIPLSRLEMRQHSCAVFDWNYEVACHACGETVSRSDITNGSHTKTCQIRACLVLHGGSHTFNRQGCLMRCGETHFTSTSNLCVQLWRHQAEHGSLKNQLEILKEEKAAEEAAALAIRGELEGCKRRLELAASSDVGKENAMLRMALMNEWKQFRSLEREFYGRANEFSLSSYPLALEEAACLSLEEEVPLDAAALQPQLNLLEEGIVESAKPLLRFEASRSCVDSNLSQELKAVEARLIHKSRLLHSREEELENCKLDIKMLRWSLLCTVLLWLVTVYFLVRNSNVAHLTCS